MSAAEKVSAKILQGIQIYSTATRLVMRVTHPRLDEFRVLISSLNRSFGVQM